MKTIKNMLGCALFVSIMSFSAFSQESKVCTKTLKTICNETKEYRKKSSNFINGFKKEIAKEAKKTKKSNNIKIEMAKAIVKEIYALISSPKNVLMFKNYMFQAIDESNFDESIRTSFKNSIESVIIADYSEFYESDKEKYKFLKPYGVINCGMDGMDINAFSASFNNQKYVFFCPGFLIDLSQVTSEQERLNGILQMMSHELGHHIDTKLLGDKVYMPYLSCISENYSNEFKRTTSDNEFCKKKAKDESECNLQITKSHAKELIADQWAIKVLTIHARTQRYSVAETDRLLTSSFVNICETATEGIHPTGDFRIGTLLRFNPEISDSLACNNSSVKRPACTFDGVINL